MSAQHHRNQGLISECSYSPAWEWLLGMMRVKSFLSKYNLVCNNTTSVCFGWTSVLKQEDVFFILDIIYW